MKITVLQGSPNRDGSTAVLIENFMKGAQRERTYGERHRHGSRKYQLLHRLCGLRI